MPGLGMGIIVAIFQMEGTSVLAIDRLKRAVRKLIAMGPKCLRNRILILSGPTAVEFPEDLMSSWTKPAVKGAKLWSRRCDSLKCLARLRELAWWTLGSVPVNCLQKALEISVSLE